VEYASAASMRRRRRRARTTRANEGARELGVEHGLFYYKLSCRLAAARGAAAGPPQSCLLAEEADLRPADRNACLAKARLPPPPTGGGTLGISVVEDVRDVAGM